MMQLEQWDETRKDTGGGNFSRLMSENPAN